MSNPLASDLDHILAHTEGLWEELRGQRLFITGGTGFFGCWLLESFLWANDRLGLDASATVLTRDPAALYAKAPHVASHPRLRFHVGDVRSFRFPSGSFSHFVHAATDASAKLNDENPMMMFDTIVQGTRRSLEFAHRCGAKKLLFASSGAVYGTQSPEIYQLTEDHTGAPDPTDIHSAYGSGKRAAEAQCAIYSKHFQVEAKIARCFAFVGPYLPLNTHFAIGNFIRDALNGGPIRVQGDGTAHRSYLYAADLAIWLWTILFRGEPNRPYNVGSEDDHTIAELANLVAELFKPRLEVQIANRPVAGRPAHRYVPSTKRTCLELRLRTEIGIRDALMRTLVWHRNSRTEAVTVAL